MKIKLSEILSNQEAASILDEWHFNAGYEIYRIDQHLYRLDTQQPQEGLRYVEILDLVQDWIETLTDRQSIHDNSDEVKEKERQEIEILQVFLDELKNEQ